jgi:hypothetical protein
MSHAHGVPAPRYELMEQLPSGVVIVQELLPGHPPLKPGRRTIESMVEVNHACRTLLAERHDLSAPSLYLRADGPGFCLHEPLARYDGRTRLLLDAIEEIGVAAPEHLPGEDLVHFDFHPGNILVHSSGTVTGVVDWDAATRSNGDFDLITLRFYLARHAPDLSRWVGGLLRGLVSDDVAQASWAHLSLRQIDWSIRHHSPADTSAWLHIAKTLQP